MPFSVKTVSADKITWVEGRPTVTPPNMKLRSIPIIDIFASPSERYTCRATQLTPRLHLVTPGSPVAVKCESVQLFNEVGWSKNGVGRVSIVNSNGYVIYDTFVYHPKRIEQRLSPRYQGLGITREDMKPEHGAQMHAHVLAAIKAIFHKSGVVVAHALIEQEGMLHGLDLSAYDVCDTQHLSGFPSNGRQLATLAAEVLGSEIQVEARSSVEDAKTTMDLFLWHREKYRVEESEHASDLRDSLSPENQVAGTFEGALTPASESLTEQAMVAQASLLLQPPFLPKPDSMSKITSWLPRVL